MNDYSQPAFYHFSEDSLLLARFVKDEQLEIHHLLDICAGSGIVGIEILRAQKTLSTRSATFIEIQKEFLSHIKKNSLTFIPSIKTQIELISLGEFHSPKSFDCIVSNPPYFQKNHGRKKADARSQLCRTFEVDSLQVLLELIIKVRSPKGKAYIIGRNDSHLCCELYSRFGFKEAFRVKSISIYKLA